MSACLQPGCRFHQFAGGHHRLDAIRTISRIIRSKFAHGERLDVVTRALVASLREPAGGSPSFRRTWQIGGAGRPAVHLAQNRIQTDNSTSQTHTIFDIFAVDRPGLLYAIARTLFESGLSVSRAKIATFLDQVVDVFYVTDQAGAKIEDESQLAEIRRRLLEAIEAGKSP